MARRRSIPARDEPLDLIVIGAGINGAGIARDAALRGLRVLLLERGDLASGTTSWSTRLIHGGLRYLEHFELGLVRESLRERETLLRIAPHLIRPLSFFVPVYEGDRRGPLQIRAGMLAYDALSFDKTLDRHRMLSAEEALEREPGLNRDGLRGGAVYFDAQAEYPERLAVENALAAMDAGATVVARASVEQLFCAEGAVLGVEYRDELSGRRHSARAPLTVNVTGPWVDQVLGNLDRTAAGRLIGGTKGSHLVVEPFEGAPDEALYVSAQDERPYFIVPWNDLYLIGTTDSRFDGDLDWVVADDEEIEYLIRETNRVVPDARLERSDVVYTYAGVRPLPYSQEGDAGSVTRRHVIHDHAPDLEGLVSIVGGKLTTYRNLAEEATDLIFEKLHRNSPESRTAELKLPGGEAEDFDAFSEQFTRSGALPEAVARRLLRTYGTNARAIAERAREEPPLGECFDSRTKALAAEVAFAFEEELAEHLDDILMRRTMVGLAGSVGIGPDEAAARIAMDVAGWSEDRALDEVRRYRELITRLRPRDLPRAPDA
ncbi:MAG: glycerol-3-phosphate dehydrogenase/oxidase [Thermoleophilaceae bacterium]